MYDNYEKDLNTELYTMHKNLNISFEELYNMPVMYRRNLTLVHNKYIEEENARFDMLRNK